jgi:hypothetical protein
MERALSRIDNGKKSDYALIQLERVGVGTVGKVDLVQPLAMHSEKGGPAEIGSPYRPLTAFGRQGFAGPLRRQNQKVL